MPTIRMKRANLERKNGLWNVSLESRSLHGSHLCCWHFLGFVSKGRLLGVEAVKVGEPGIDIVGYGSYRRFQERLDMVSVEC